MTLRLDELTLAETEKPVVRPILLAWLDFVSGTKRLWSGIGNLIWDGQTWEGTGDFGRVSSIEETIELRAAGMALQLSGVDTDDLTEVIAEPIQGRRAKVYIGFRDANFQLVSDPIVIFDGRMDTIEIVDGGSTATITMNVENRLRDLDRARVRRYTDACQQSRYPGDKGLEYVPSLQEIDIPWGRAKE
jgi:hypothetical protein